MENLIVPNQVDIDRAKTMKAKSSRAQIESNFNRIKDIEKVMRRAIALTTIDGYESYYATQRFNSMNPTPEQKERYALTLKFLKDKRDAEYKARKMAHDLKCLPAMTILREKIFTKIKALKRNQVLNLMGLNKNCFGSIITVKNIKVNWNKWQGRGDNYTPVRITVEFEHLSGYFMRDLGYSLILDLSVNGEYSVFKRDGWKAVYKLGKKDTKNLLEAVKGLEDFRAF